MIDQDPTAEITHMVEEEMAPAHEAPKKERVLARGDEVELAACLIKDLGGEEFLVCDDDLLYMYDHERGVWEALEDDVVRRIIMGYAGAKVFKGKLKDGTIKTAALKMGSKSSDGILRCAKIALSSTGFFDTAPRGVCFSNKFLIFDADGEGRLIDHAPENKARHRFEFSYRSDRRTGSWLKFLAEIFCGDDDADQKVEFIRQFMGMCLLGGATSHDTCPILLGEGANGKSVLLTVLSKAFPEGTISSIPPQRWGHEYYAAALAGKMLNVVTEMPERDIINADATKAVISGDPVIGRNPAGRPFSFRPRAGHVFAANRLPGSIDYSDGFFRRWVILKFNRNFEDEGIKKERSSLVDELSVELPGIVCWAIEGAAKVIKAGGYTSVPDSSSVVKKQWRSSVDQIATWLEESAEMAEEEDEYAYVFELYRNYIGWTTRTGHKQMSKTRFTERLKRLKVKLKGKGHDQRASCYLSRTDP